MKDLKLDTNIEELILSNEYHSLSDDDKAVVLSSITEKEYNNYREILLSINEDKSHESLSGNKEDLNVLLSSFDAAHTSKERSIIKIIFEYTLPVYKIAAGMLLILTASYIINMKFFPASHDRIVFITDTVYKEVLVPESIWLADSSVKADYYKQDIAKNKDTQKKDSSNNAVPDETNYFEESKDIEDYARHVGILTDRDLITFRRKHNNGKSLYEDSILKDFLVVTP